MKGLNKLNLIFVLVNFGLSQEEKSRSSRSGRKTIGKQLNYRSSDDGSVDEGDVVHIDQICIVRSIHNYVQLKILKF